MKLKKLEITGFKSFVDKAAIQFPTGISAVVGPNGCGKSNIIDALRWVMGEQSVKQLRGKAMEDIIFAGTKGRPPMNMAEVSLTLANDNGSAPEELKDFSEIMLTRRLYRSGESAYLINKQPCRLKDVHNVFWGSGLGAKSFAVIQQGNIGAITDAGPEERRVFIEEAAGITRYKNRKNEALRKVHSTNQNLLRVLDIMTEVKRQMDGLKRQVRKAERYKKYQEQIKQLDVTLAIHHVDAHGRQIEKTGKLLKDLKDSDIEQTTKFKRLDAAIEEIKLKRSKKDQEISEQQSHQFEMQRNIDRTENDLSHLREDVEGLSGEITRITTARDDLEEKNTSISTEVVQVENQTRLAAQELDTVKAQLEKERADAKEISDQLSALNQTLEDAKAHLMKCVTDEARYKNTYQNATTNKENLQRRLKRIKEEEVTAEKKMASLEAASSTARETLDAFKKKIEALGGQVDTVRSRLQARSEALGNQVKQVQTMVLESKALRSNYATLKRMQENYEWYKGGVKAVMKNFSEESRKKEAGIIGMMADVIEPDSAFASAAEAVLGEALQYILVSDQGAGIRSIQYLQTSEAGRSGFIPVSSVKDTDPAGGKKPDPSKRLLNHVKVKPGYENIAETLLGHVVVTEDLEEAIALWNRNGVRQAVVTKNGDVITHQGILIGGSAGKNGPGILAKKQELKALKNGISELDQKLEAAHKIQDALESKVRNIEVELQRLLEQKETAGQNENDAEKALYRVSEDLKYARRHLEIVLLEGEQLAGEESDIDTEITKFDQAIVAIEAEVKTAQERVATTSEQIHTVSSDMDEYSQRIVDLKLKLTALNAQMENSRANFNRLKTFHEDGIRQLKELSEEIVQKKQKRIAFKQKIIVSEQSLSSLYEELKQLEQSIEHNRVDFDTIEATLQENDTELNEIQSRRGAILEKIRLLELEHSQQNLRRENIIDQIEDRYHTAFSDLKHQFAQTATKTVEPAERPVEEMEEQLSKLRKRIALIGDVNLGAIGEYEDLKNRYEFLTTQHDDLVSAIEDLHKVVRKINRITRKRFMETFDRVNEKLKEVFPRLFEGGSAQLELTEPDNPLETGVEYLIHPPGKKLTRMSLLSGGEKALSAIAFVFAIFLIRPASFCLLDEIDAPLDEANIYRFNNLLQVIGEKSQIVMITHNKKSMEFADTLFGITMEQKGISKVVSVNFSKPE